MKARRWCGQGLAALFLVVSWHNPGTGATPESSNRVLPAVRGASSCAAMACHGSIRPAAPNLFPSNVLRNEHTTWVTQDKHANAYQVLFSKRSQLIAQKLTGGKVPAHEDARCLACHATPSLDPLAKDGRTVTLRSDGVSCEACHGPADLWLAAHTQAGWRDASPDFKAQYGMTVLKDLDRRAAVCVGCHVGAPAKDGLPGRDVNHDLIAAGHPRLNFEFAAFLANVPPHWAEDTTGAFAARTWAVGQVVAAKAALDLLESRARLSKAHPDLHPWPEFSEYHCFSCHHDLADQAWRKDRRDPTGPPGAPPWGSWYFALTLPMAAALAPAGADSLKQHLPRLRAEMVKPLPDRDKAAAEAGQAASTLAQWIQAQPDARTLDDAVARRLIGSFKSPDAVTSWDEAAQLYLALQPLNQSWGGLAPRDQLDLLYQKLTYPKNYDSPKGFDPGRLVGGH